MEEKVPWNYAQNGKKQPIVQQFVHFHPCISTFLSYILVKRTKIVYLQANLPTCGKFVIYSRE